MKRHPLLIELSQEHHHTLALCVRILRSPETDHRHDITEHFIDLEKHFSKEETMFAPLWDKLDRADLRSRFEQEHARLRELFHHAQWNDAAWNTENANSSPHWKNTPCRPPDGKKQPAPLTNPPESRP